MNSKIKIMGMLKVEHDYPSNYDTSDLNEFEGEKLYNTYDLFLTSEGFCRVSSDSVVYKKFNLLEKSLANLSQRQYYRVRYLGKKYLLAKKVRLSKSDKHLLITDAWSSGHFHWFSEILPKLLCLRDKASEFVLLLPDTPYLRKIGMESLEMMGIVFSDIVWMKEDCFYTVPDLYFVNRISRTGQMHPGLMQELHRVLVPRQEKATRKIYISREKAQFRKLVNEKEVVAMLKSNGFEVFIGEDFSLREQAAVFSDTETLLGLHGAGLSNMIFMQPGSNLVELRRKESGSTNVGYWHMADALGLRYLYFNGSPDSALPLVGNGCNLSVDLAALERQVLQRL